MAAKNTELMSRITTRQGEVSGVLDEVSKHLHDEPKKFESLRDKYPNMGPALVRMIPYFCGDLEEMLETYPALKSLVTEDMEYNIEKSMAPVPASQDVDVWKGKLEAANKLAQKRLDAANNQAQRRLDQANIKTEKEKELTAYYRDRLATSESELRESTAKASASKQLWTKREGQYEQKVAQLRSSRDTAHQKAQEMSTESEVHKASAVRYKSERDEARSNLENAKKDVAAKDAKIAELNMTIDDLVSRGDGADLQLVDIQTTVQHLREQIARTEQEHESTVEEIRADAMVTQQNLKGDVRSLETDKEILGAELAAKKTRVTFLETRLNQAHDAEKGLLDEKNTLWAKIQELNSKISELKAEMAQNRTDLDEARVKLATSKADADSKGFEVIWYQKKYTKVHQQLEEVKAKLLEDFKEGNVESATEQKRLQDEIDHHKDKCEELKGQRNDYQNRWEKLGEREERMRHERETAIQDCNTANARFEQAQSSLEKAMQELQLVGTKLERAREQQQEAFAEKDNLTRQHAQRLRAEDAKLKEASDGWDAEKIVCESLKRQLRSHKTAATSKDETINDLQADVEAERQTVLNLRTELRLQKDQNKPLQASIEAQASKIESLEDDAKQEKNETQRLQGDVVVQTTKANNLQTQLVSKIEDLERETRERERLQSELDEKQRAKAGLETELTTQKKLVSDLCVEVTTLKDNVEGLSNEVLVKTGQLNAQTKNASDLRFELGTAKTASLEQTTDLQNQIKVLNSDLKSAREATEGVKTEKKTLINSVQEGQNEMMQLRTNARTLGERIESLNRQIAQVKKSKEELECYLERNQAALTQEAESKLEALVLFFSELCDCVPNDCRGLVAEIQQDSVHNVVLNPSQPDFRYWTVLDTWMDDQTKVSNPASNTSLAALVVDAVRAIASNEPNSWRLQSTLRAMTKTVFECQDTVVHEKVFVGLARLLVEAQPSFEVVLAFWQIMQAVDQRWQPPPQWAEEKSVLESFLQDHVYAAVFDLVSGTGQIVENDECHIFQETAVMTRPVVKTAVLVNANDRSIRFFSKKRYKSLLDQAEIKSPVDGDEVLALRILNKADMHWSLRFAIESHR